MRKRELEDIRKWTGLGLRRTIGENMMDKFEQLTERKTEKIYTRTRDNQRKKFEELLSITEKKDGAERKDHTQWVVNLSDHKLTPAERSALERGLKFATAPRRIPAWDIISSIDPALK